MGKSVESQEESCGSGRGKDGVILLQSFLRDGLLSPAQTWATVAHPERARALKEKLKVHAGTDNLEAVQDADIIFLCVKPQVVADVVREIRAHVNRNQLLISVAASVPTDMIERGLEKEVPVVRAMPNTPCVLGAGMTALCKGKICAEASSGNGDEVFRCGGANRDRRRKTHGRGHRALGERAGVYLHHSGVAGGGGRESRPAARYRNAAGGADDDGRGAGRARNRRSSGAAEGRSDHSGGLHDRRHHGTGRRQAARDADQGGGEGGAAG